MGRKIKVIDTANSKVHTFENSESQTWGSFLEEAKSTIDLSKSKATIMSTKATLDHIDAVLPEEDFNILIRPSKNKAGSDIDNFDFKQARNWIKENPGIKEYFKKNPTSDGRNWTQFKTPELVQGIKDYNLSCSLKTEEHQEVPKTVEETVNTTVIEEETEVVETKTESIKNSVENVIIKEEDNLNKDEKDTFLKADYFDYPPEGKLHIIKSLAESLLEDFKDSPNLKQTELINIESDFQMIFDVIPVIEIQIEKVNATEEELQKIADEEKRVANVLAEKRKKEKEENDALLEEAKKISRNFL